MKIKKIVFAIEAEAADIPVKPNIPAIIAITRKITAQRSIAKDLRWKNCLQRTEYKLYATGIIKPVAVSSAE